MVVDICRQCLAAEVIVISNFLGPECVGGVVCNPEHGGVLFPDHKFPMMMVSFSSFLMQPAKVWLLFIFFCLSAEKRRMAARGNSTNKHPYELPEYFQRCVLPWLSKSWIER
jgi:hypothetical protein